MLDILLLAVTQKIQSSGLILGVFSIVMGLFLMRAHRSAYGVNLSDKPTEGLVRFEQRKMRRRTIIAGLVTSIGCMLVALFWVNEVRVLAIFSLMIMLQLIIILGFAMVDMFSVGIRTLTRIDERPQKEMIEEFLRQHELSSSDQESKEKRKS